MANIIDKLNLTGTASLAEELDSTLEPLLCHRQPAPHGVPAWPTSSVADCSPARCPRKAHGGATRREKDHRHDALL